MTNETQPQILYGICQWSMPALKPAVAARTLRELDLDGIELDSGKWDGTQLTLADGDLQRQWSEACVENALQVPALGVNSLCDEGMSKPEKKEIVRAILANSVEIAAAMQIPALQLPSFFDGVIRTELDLKTTAGRLQEVCDLALAHGIVVGTENALSVEDCVKLIELTDRDNLKVFFDTQNPWAMEGMNAAEVLRGEYPYLYDAAHAKDGHGSKLSSALLGQGDSDFAQTMAVFVENDYAGWLILENSYDQIPDPANWQANVAADMDSIRKTLG